MALAARASASPCSASCSAPEAKEHVASLWMQSLEGPRQEQGLGAAGSALPWLCLGCAGHSPERGWAAGATGQEGCPGPYSLVFSELGGPRPGSPRGVPGPGRGWSLGCPGQVLRGKGPSVVASSPCPVATCLHPPGALGDWGGNSVTLGLAGPVRGPGWGQPGQNLSPWDSKLQVHSRGLPGCSLLQRLLGLEDGQAEKGPCCSRWVAGPGMSALPLWGVSEC